MEIKTYRDLITEADTRREKLVQEKVDYAMKDLDPVMSEATLDYHYGKLASGYVKRWNAKEGDDDFNYGGATLHNLFFPQLRVPTSSNRPQGKAAEVINTRWKSFENFKEEFVRVSMGIQGSGWVYMDPKGDIKVIKNHEYKKNLRIMLIVDWWEHAWALDYQHDKSKYLKNIWRIIDWSVVNDRLQQGG